MSILTLSGSDVVTIPGRSATAKGYIAPAATFTSTTPSSASGGTKTTLTSAGAHGLTAAVAVGKTINITAGTGWTAGFYNVSSIDLDTTGVAITIDVAYDAGMGTPTIALAGTESTFHTVTIPPLSAVGFIEIDATWSMASNTNTKIPTIRLGGSLVYGPSVASAGAAYCRPSNIVIQNRDVTNSQITGLVSANSSQNGTAASTTTLTVDTSASTSLTIAGKANTANDYIYIERYLVKVFK